MSPKAAPVLIVKAPGRVRDGLCTLLSHQPYIQLVGTIHAEQALLQQITAQSWAGVVLLDTDFLGSKTLSWFQHLKLAAPSVRWILLVDTISQQAQALADGASDTLIKGFSADELVAAIRRVISARSPETAQASTVHEPPAHGGPADPAAASQQGAGDKTQ
jgi:DNA-binding NarL/FixJ family response regulator